MTPISKETERALKNLEEFDPVDFACNLMLDAPLEELTKGDEFARKIEKLVDLEHDRLHAIYVTCLKQDMAKAEDEDCWQKV